MPAAPRAPAASRGRRATATPAATAGGTDSARAVATRRACTRACSESSPRWSTTKRHTFTGAYLYFTIDGRRLLAGSRRGGGRREARDDRAGGGRGPAGSRMWGRRRTLLRLGRRPVGRRQEGGHH